MQRLKTRAQFQAALAGRVVSKTPHFALHRAQLDAKTKAPPDVDQIGAETTGAKKPWLTQPLFSTNGVWLGAMVPKRWAKQAVTRNTLKRQIYIVSSLFAPKMQHAAHVVRLRATFDREQYRSATSPALKTVAFLELQQLFAQIFDRTV